MGGDFGPTVGLTERQLAASTNVDRDLLKAGIDFVEDEKQMSVRDALKYHWRAAMWSCFLSFALVMEGYDQVIIGSFYGQTAFLERFGDLQPDGSYLIAANWQSGISNSAYVGQLIGVCLTGYFQERIGSKKTYCAGMVLMMAFIFVMVFATSVPMLLAGELLCGIPWGMFQTLTTAYAAEICPIKLRGILAAFVNMCWGIGIFLSSGIARASLNIEGQWGWRMPFALQWVWPVPLFLACLFAPESPWWLARHDRFEDAKASLMRTAAPGYYDNRSIDGYVALMKHTNDLEKAESQGASFLELFKGTNLRRTEILFLVWFVQAFCGQGITDFTVVLFESAGFNEVQAFDLSMALNSMFIIGTIGSWFLLGRFGRRTIYLAGLQTTGIALIIIGVLAAATNSQASKYTIGVFLILVNLIYNLSLGPLGYTISGEIPASRIRAMSIAFGRSAYIISNIITGQIKPRMLSPTAWNLGAKSAFFWLGTNVVCTVWSYFRLPETRGLSFSEIDILFANKVATRQFGKVKVIDDAAEPSGSDSLNGPTLEDYDAKVPPSHQEVHSKA